MVTKHLLKELRHELTLVNHVDSQSAKEWASKRGLGRMKHAMPKYMFVQDIKKKVDDTCLCKYEFEQGRLDDEVSYV